MKFIKLQDGTTLEIKVNMLTLNMIAKGKHNLSEASKTEDSNEQIEMMSTMIYALMYSNGKKISKEDALALVPIDETDTFFELISGFQEEVEKFQKKSQEKLNLLKITK